MNRIAIIAISLINMHALSANSLGAQQEISAQARILGINSTVATLDLLLGQAPPAGLVGAEQTQWNAVTAWITESRNKLAELAAQAEGRPSSGARDANRARGAGRGDVAALGGKQAGAVDTTRSGAANRAARGSTTDRAARGAATDTAGRAAAARASLPAANAASVAQLNTRFLALVQDIKAKGSRFQTLSNANKARHDIAMKAINNLK